eukprot:c120_g1_i2.p1 GENE.c120_g1_i2~~c120_g1_i2.p1  ORF type:complete len:410 (-),score=119.41 c120_g1_i2:276-1505(-)
MLLWVVLQLLGSSRTHSPVSLQPPTAPLRGSAPPAVFTATHVSVVPSNPVLPQRVKSHDTHSALSEPIQQTVYTDTNRPPQSAYPIHSRNKPYTVPARPITRTRNLQIRGLEFDLSDECILEGHCTDAIPTSLLTHHRLDPSSKKSLKRTSFFPESKTDCVNGTEKATILSPQEVPELEQIPLKRPQASHFISSRQYYPILVIPGYNATVENVLESLKQLPLMISSTAPPLLFPFPLSVDSSDRMLADTVADMCSRIVTHANSSAFASGVNVIGYGVGGTIARAVVQMCTGISFKNVLSFCAPQMGLSDVSALACQLAPEHCTTGTFDPDEKVPQLARDLKASDGSNFISHINNLEGSIKDDYKKKIAQLTNLVAVACESDTLTVPKASAVFGWEDPNGVLVPMSSTPL